MTDRDKKGFVKVSYNKTVLLFLLMAVLGFLFPALAFSADKTIGIIMTGDIPYYQELHSVFMARLEKEKSAGHPQVLVQRPYPDPISLSNAARKLIAMDVDVIVVYGTPAALAVVQEKTKIPMVYAAVYEPFVSKIKTKTTTGIETKLSVSSLLRYLRGLTQISTLGVVYSSSEDDSYYQMKEVTKLSQQYGFRVDAINLKRHQDARQMLSNKKVDAIFITGSAVAHLALPTIIEFARDRRIPHASFMLNRNTNVIITLAADPAEQGGKAAEKVLRILDGVSPDRIRPESSSDTELVFNLKEATAMGFKLPMDLVTGATRLIK
jgi:putative ABC transport system substrate-binding protein